MARKCESIRSTRQKKARGWDIFPSALQNVSPFFLWPPFVTSFFTVFVT